MAKVSLDSISSGYQSRVNLNDNFQAVENELNNNVLYRNNPEGEPNNMEQELDMDSNRLINVGNGVLDGDGINLKQARDLLTENISLIRGQDISFSISALEDVGKLFYCTNNVPITCTIENDNATTEGSLIYITQAGTSYIQVVGGSGVTVNSPDGNATRAEYSTIAMMKNGQGEWLLLGDLGYYIV